MNGKLTTVKDLKDFLSGVPDDALVHRVINIDEGEKPDRYVVVVNIWEEDGHVMID